MSAPTIAIGAVVYLRSGSPKMTVTRLFDVANESDGEITKSAEVAYHAFGTMEVVRNAFPVAALDIKSVPPGDK